MNELKNRALELAQELQEVLSQINSNQREAAKIYRAILKLLPGVTVVDRNYMGSGFSLKAVLDLLPRTENGHLNLRGKSQRALYLYFKEKGQAAIGTSAGYFFHQTGSPDFIEEGNWNEMLSAILRRLIVSELGVKISTRQKRALKALREAFDEADN